MDPVPKASSTVLKPQRNRLLENYNISQNANDTFGTMYSDELTGNDLMKKSFTDETNNKNPVKMDSLYSSISGQSSLGIFELDNMSDIMQNLKKEDYPHNIESGQPTRQRRSSQNLQAGLTLARSSKINSFANDKSSRLSLSNKTNVFRDMSFQGINSYSSSFSSDDFIPGSEFKENLAEIEEVNRKEYGSLSESRFNFTLEGEMQSLENGSFAAKYFAAKSVPVEELSAIFPKKKNINESFSKGLQQEEHTFFKNNTQNKSHNEQISMGYKTMSSVTSWTDTHVSHNFMNMTSLSEISEMLSNKIDDEKKMNLTKALLAGDSHENTQMDKSIRLPQRRLSTSTRFSNVSHNLEHADLSYSTLDHSSFGFPEKKLSKMENSIVDSPLKYQKNLVPSKQGFFDSHRDIENHDLYNDNVHSNKKNSTKIIADNMGCIENTSISYTSSTYNGEEKKMIKNECCHFTLSPISGFFEDCTFKPKKLENSVDLTKFSILSTSNEEYKDNISFNKSANISKIVHCYEALCQEKFNKTNHQDYNVLSNVLDIGDVCIGTYSQAIITLENRLSRNTSYTLHLMEVLVNSPINSSFLENEMANTKIATVLCSKKTIIISSSSEAQFIIGVIPLVSGKITVKVKLISDDNSQEIYRNVQIQSAEPKVSWLNNYYGSIDFGLVPEMSKKSVSIELMNNGKYQVPIKFILSQEDCNDVVQAKAIIEPSELWQCNVNFITSDFPLANNTTKLITSRLRVVLDSVEELSKSYSPLLYSSNLSGRMGLTSISFDQNPLILKKQGQTTFRGVVEVQNNSVQALNLLMKKSKEKCSDLVVQPNKLELAVNKNGKIHIFCKFSKLPYTHIEEDILFQVESSKKQFVLHIKVEQNETSFNIPELSLSNIPSSRPISPWSTSSSSAIGQLELESTCSSLIWGSVPPNTKSVQTFTLRNRGTHKEKLRLFIKDNKNCFKLISSGENQVSEIKLLLESMESQKISVVLVSTSNEGEAFGQVVVHRQHGSDCDKRVIPLYGYCGYSDIIVQGVFEDTMGHMWLNPNPQLLSAQFTLTNSGNTTAFVKIIQGSSVEDEIQPNEFMLKKGETTTIHISIVMNPERLEILLDHDDNSKIININNLSLVYGDEVSRIRISRIWQQIKKSKKTVMYPDKQRLDEISNLFDGVNIVNVNHMVDSEKSLFKLWKMGVNEVSIGILMERTCLESLLCETTTVFNDLDTTVINRMPL